MSRNKIIVALDVDTPEKAVELVRLLNDDVGAFKVGLELFHSEGPDVIKMVHEHSGPCFYDGKFCDIPNTVAGAAAAITRLGVKLFNVHTLGGEKMMAENL